MISTEDVLFIMPRDRELQFPAMAALQRYINDYEVKMQANCVIPDMPKYMMRYKVQMLDEDWQFFQRLGIDLKQQPEEIGFPDSVIELSDEKLLSFYNSDKHCAQVCAAIAGVEAPPFPKVKLVNCGQWSGCLKVIETVLGLKPEYVHAEATLSSVDIEDLLRWQQVDGTSILTPIVIGYQSWQTYAAAAMGMPVVEILQKGRSVSWLSKWKNAAYRIIEEDRMDRLPDALSSIRAVLEWRFSQAQAGKAEETLTAAIASTAPNADSTSPTPLSH